MRRFFIPLLILLGAPHPLVSQEQIPHSEIVEAVLAYTAASSQLELYQQSLLKGIEAFQEILEPATYASLRDAVESHYAPQKLRNEISWRTAPQLNRSHLITFLRWYESPVGSKISREERAANRAAWTKEYTAFRTQEVQKHRSVRRRLLLDRLDAHLDTRTIFHSTLTTHFRKLLEQSDPQIFGSPGTESVTVKRNIESLLDRTENRHRDMMDVMRYFTYRRVTNDELQMYNEFYDSKDGAWLQQLVSLEMYDALNNALIQAIKSLAAAPGNRPG